MPSEVSICNQAITWLAGNQITSLDDDTNEGRLCKANYSNLRDAVLEERAWTFATKRLTPAKESEAPDWGYASKFLIPSKVLRLLIVTDDPSNVNSWDDGFDWRREGSAIVCDVDVIYVKYIEKIIAPALFSPGFAQTLAARIAREIAVPLTESGKMYDRMDKLYDKLLKGGGATDGMQGASDKIKSSSLTRVR